MSNDTTDTMDLELAWEDFDEIRRDAEQALTALENGDEQAAIDKLHGIRDRAYEWNDPD